MDKQAARQLRIATPIATVVVSALAVAAGAGWLAPVVVIVGIVAFAATFASPGTPEQQVARQARADELAYGPLREAMVCPHCQTRGRVHTKGITRKAGISGGKAAGAVLTGGLSLLATGLSRSEHVTAAHCCGCGATWTF